MAELRARTAPMHALVDAAFGGYDLTDRTDYCAFLTAHARVLPEAERVLAADRSLPASRRRGALLAEDLETLGQAMPETLSFADAQGTAAGWGLLYVIEGSRLGGILLAGRVSGSFPTAFLGARHEPGEWRTLGRSIDAEAAAHGATWLDEAASGAVACFGLYLDAARAA